MDQATEGDIELSILKTANISGYLLNLSTICSTISTARNCIASCGIDSNPFALESMTVVCSQQALADVEQSASKCLLKQGNQIIDQCKTECGDYHEINNQVHKLSESYRPEANEPTKLEQLMSKINDGCATLKCSNRCATKLLSEQCSVEENDGNVGSFVKSVIETVLTAQRNDLEKMQLVDAMAQSVPKQCTFMYMPETMFNKTKDETAMAVIEEKQRSEQSRKLEVPVEVTSPEMKKANLNLALSQLQARLFRKQMHLLDMQEKNLIRESHKLDLELRLLAKKQEQPEFDGGVIKQF